MCKLWSYVQWLLCTWDITSCRSQSISSRNIVNDRTAAAAAAMFKDISRQTFEWAIFVRVSLSIKTHACSLFRYNNVQNISFLPTSQAFYYPTTVGIRHVKYNRLHYQPRRPMNRCPFLSNGYQTLVLRAIDIDKPSTACVNDVVTWARLSIAPASNSH